MRLLEPGAGAPEPASVAEHRRPRVLAFVRDWTPPSTVEVEPIRAQLRGLGAELVVIAARGAWLVRPEDAIARIDDAETRELAVAATRYGARGDRDAVFVVGADATIRFSHVHDAPLGGSLARALDAALAEMHTRHPPPVAFTRREWVTSCLVSGFAFALFASCRSSHDRETDDTPAPDPVRAPDVAPNAPPLQQLDVVLDINGAKHALAIDPRTSLLDALRELLGLTGTKKGCDGGQCGACTVHVGGQRVVSCLTLAAVAEGQPIRTIEGLGSIDKLHPIQAAFVEHDAFQCGFCTPGQIMSAVALLAENRAHDDETRSASR